MRIGRTLPPAVAPLTLGNIFSGVTALFQGDAAVHCFQQSLRNYFNQQHCFTVSSGKAALTLILRALKHKHPKRTRVLIPAFSCYSIPSAIIRAGLEISLCDVDPNTLDYETTQLETKLKDPLLLCVISVHLFGVPAAVQTLRDRINDPQVVLIEDAAQAMGTLHQDSYLGTRGDVGIFSLGRGKALSTVEGGVVITDSDELAALLQQEYRRYFEYSLLQKIKLLGYALALWMLSRPVLFWLPKSLPFLKLGETIYDPQFPLQKLSNVQAGFADNWQIRLKKSQQKRAEHTSYWHQRIPIPVLKGVGECILPLLRFPLRLNNDSVASRLVADSDQQGLGIAFSYPDAICEIPELASHFAGQDYPAARKLAHMLLTLPVHEYVSRNDQIKIEKLLDEQTNSQHGDFNG